MVTDKTSYTCVSWFYFIPLSITKGNMIIKMNYKVKNLSWMMIIRIICFSINMLYLPFDGFTFLSYCATELLIQSITLLSTTINYNLKFVKATILTEKIPKHRLFSAIFTAILFLRNVSFFEHYTLVGVVISFVTGFTFLVIYQITRVSHYCVAFSDSDDSNIVRHVVKYLKNLNHLHYLYLLVLFCFTISNCIIGEESYSPILNYIFICLVQIILMLFMMQYVRLVSKELISHKENHLSKTWFFHIIFVILMIFIANILYYIIKPDFWTPLGGKYWHTYLNLKLAIWVAGISSISLFLRVYFRIKSLHIYTSSF